MFDVEDEIFCVGDDVIKISGDYNWRGVVCGRFQTPNELTRYVVAHSVDKGYVLHIYAPSNLRKVDSDDD